MRSGCWFAHRPGAGPCSGRLQRAHWIKQQVLRREVGPLALDCPTCGAPAGEHCARWPKLSCGGRVLALQAVLWDPRVWTLICETHHRALDHARTLRVDRVELPRGVEEYAAERGLAWWLDREYGERQEQAA